jgi:glycosyltransferase involved in cell wall biosynthesis
VSAPLVSVITPTWSRHEKLLNRCIPSVQAQTYRNVEHVIVSDGPDPELAEKAGKAAAAAYHPVAFIELPGPHPGGNRYGAAARLAGIEAASGDLIAYLDDDDAYRPEHCAVLARLLEEDPSAGWAYSTMASHSRSGLWTVIGLGGTPQYGQIGTPMIMHRRSVLDHGTWGPASVTEDWELVQRWQAAGVPYACTSDTTVDVYPSVYWQ